MEIKLDNINYYNKLIDINYIFSKGSITSIIGNSGSGKSLFGYILMDIIKDYDGDIIVDGKQDYDKNEYLKKVGYVSQNPWKHFISKTVEEEISFGLKSYNYKLDKISKQINDSLNMVGLSNDYLNKNLFNLSSGEAFRVALASSLAMNPKVLILDEPTIYLDNNGKEKLLKLLLLLKNKFNKTIIIMSNDMDFVYDLKNNYILLDDGRIITTGDVEKLDTNNIIFTKYKMKVPKILEFVKYVNEKKNIKLTNINSIDDIVKGVSNG